MILSDIDIKIQKAEGHIVIEPFDEKFLGSNSYDVHLSQHLAQYIALPLDAKQINPIKRLIIPEEGIILYPGMLYLGSTIEYTETHYAVPFLEGKSSIGRLGISVHATAGKGDVGFCNHWTFEISCLSPVRVYAGMPIAQLIYHTAGVVKTAYKDKLGAKYNDVSPLPKESMMHTNTDKYLEVKY